MSDNPLMNAFRKVFLRQTERAGFDHSPKQSGDEIAYKGRLIGALTINYGLEQAENLDEQDSKRFAQLQRLRERTLEPYALFRQAATLAVCDEPDTRVLCEFDRVALTARVRPDGAVAFATWQYRFDRTGVRDRCDCGTDFIAAKEQFAIRAGLLPKERCYSLDEVTQPADTPTQRLTTKLLEQVEQLNPPEVATPADRSEIGIQQTGVPYGFARRRTEPGYILKDGTALLESERDAAGNYLGGAGMDGMYLKTGKSYAPILDGEGNVRAFREVAPQPPVTKREQQPESRRRHKTDAPER